jgi:hypothetical protein
MMIASFNMQPYREAIEAGFSTLAAEEIIPRVWRRDWTVWNGNPSKIANRLGWLFCPENSQSDLPEVREFVLQARRQGLSHAVLLGMGGSSLAPLVMAEVFPTSRNALELEVLDSTDPAAVLGIQERYHPAKTVYIVSSKSGTTTETMSLFRFFWNQSCEFLGKKRASGHFVAITDPGSPFAELARGLGFSLFLAGPEIGGRFSALSVFNLLPAAFKGIRIRDILRAGNDMALCCRESTDLRANPGAHLGILLAALASHGRDKLTLVLPGQLEAFGLWLEQPIAESTGKEGRRILPVTGEKIGPPGVYGADRLFVQFRAPRSSAEEPAPDRQKDAALAGLRTRLRAKTGLATTLGDGLRYLHSTGQLHKGDRGNGLFIQITADDGRDVPIPDEPGLSGASISFGILKAAQARGDMKALKSAGRRVARLHLKNATPKELGKIAALFG